MPIQNAKEFPKRFFGMHFVPGIAEYREPDKDSYRIFVNEGTIRNMAPSFVGKPVYVRHVDEVSLTNLEQEMDGVVVRSFFNKSDGKHWVEFIVITEEGQQAIRNGWKLSNAYHPTSMAPGGIHNGLEFDQEVIQGEYDHLAIVDDPRYEESVILSPDEFKEYNEKKELELQRLANSKDKGERQMGLKLWKRAKVENALDLENTVVELPKSKKEMTITELVNAMDAVQNMNGYANGDHMVKLGDDEMSVNDLAKKYCEMKANADAEHEGEDQDEKKSPDMANAEDADADEKEMQNDGEDDDTDMMNGEDGKSQMEKKEPAFSNKKKNSKEVKKPTRKAVDADGEEVDHYHSLLNASDRGLVDDDDVVIDLPANMVARGKSRYGRG